jgi:YD repeat-containing protein
MVSDRPSEFFGMADDEPNFLSGPTHKLIRKDGGAWHLRKDGPLVATEAGGLRTVYERDEEGRLKRIVGLRGRQPVAFIEMTYDSSSKLESATAETSAPRSAKTAVKHTYDPRGRLATVTSQSGRLGYRYQGSWVTAITYGKGDSQADVNDDPTIRRLEYDARGQLRSETAANGTRTDYHATSDANGKTVTAVRAGSSTVKETIRYDPALRPLAAHYADGMRAAWSYPSEGGTILEVAGSDGASLVRLTESADRRRRTLELDDRYQIASELDATGRLSSLAEDGRTGLWQGWSPDGRLRVAGNETQAEHFEYDADGLISRVIRVPSDEEGRLHHWQETRLDPAGRPTEIKDFRGLHQSITYDDAGQMAGVVAHRDGKLYGFKLLRDDAGRLQYIHSSWGDQRYAYDEDGRLASLSIKKGRSNGLDRVGVGLTQESTAVRRRRFFAGLFRGRGSCRTAEANHYAEPPGVELSL